MMSRIDHHTPMASLRAALPYLRLYRGKVFVVKAGGEVFSDTAGSLHLLEQIGILVGLGIRVVLVHGGGPQGTKLSDRLGIETTMIEGRRVTDDSTLDVMTLALNGEVNTQIVATARRLGVGAVGLSGVDGSIIVARRRGPRVVAGSTVDYGHVGDIESIDATLVERLLAEGILPVISPLSASADGEILNVNADTVAAALAVRLGAAKFMLVTGVPGILRDVKDPSSLVSYCDIASIDGMISSGILAGGMLPKVKAVKDALQGGVPRVHILSWMVKDSVLTEIFTNDGAGTLVVKEMAQLDVTEPVATAAADGAA